VNPLVQTYRQTSEALPCKSWQKTNHLIVCVWSENAAFFMTTGYPDIFRVFNYTTDGLMPVVLQLMVWCMV